VEQIEKLAREWEKKHKTLRKVEPIQMYHSGMVWAGVFIVKMLKTVRKARLAKALTDTPAANRLRQRKKKKGSSGLGSKLNKGADMESKEIKGLPKKGEEEKELVVEGKGGVYERDLKPRINGVRLPKIERKGAK